MIRFHDRCYYSVGDTLTRQEHCDVKFVRTTQCKSGNMFCSFFCDFKKAESFVFFAWQGLNGGKYPHEWREKRSSFGVKKQAVAFIQRGPYIFLVSRAFGLTTDHTSGTTWPTLHLLLRLIIRLHLLCAIGRYDPVSFYHSVSVTRLNCLLT